MTLPHRIRNNKDITHTETALLDLIRWCSLFFPPSLCEPVLPFHSMSYYSWRAIAGGWGMSNSKNDDRTSLRLLKATASTVWAIQETRSWGTRVYLQSSDKQPLPGAACPARLAITPIPSRYADGMALSPLITHTHTVDTFQRLMV